MKINFRQTHLYHLNSFFPVKHVHVRNVFEVPKDQFVSRFGMAVARDDGTAKALREAEQRRLAKIREQEDARVAREKAQAAREAERINREAKARLKAFRDSRDPTKNN